MTYALSADLHIHPWSAFAQTLPDGQNSRLVGQLQEIERMAQELHEKTGPGGNVFWAGDIFHVRGSVAPSVLNALKDCMAGCREKWGTNFHIMPGNHDLEGKNSTRLGSAVTALEEVAQVYNTSTRVGQVVMVPWYESIEDLVREIERIAPDDRASCDLLLHAPIDGVIEGLPAHGLTPEMLSSLGFKRVFAGHYHNHKEFSGNVYSIGALAHYTWSDVGAKAGFLLVGDDTPEVDWRSTRLPKFVDLDRIEVDDPDELAFLVEGNYVRTKIDAASSAVVEELRESLTAMGAKGILIAPTPTPPKREGAVTATVAAGASLEVSVAEYVKSLALTEPGTVLKEALAVLSAVDAD